LSAAQDIPGALGKRLTTDAGRARLSRELTELRTNTLPGGLDWSAMARIFAN